MVFNHHIHLVGTCKRGGGGVFADGHGLGGSVPAKRCRQIEVADRGLGEDSRGLLLGFLEGLFFFVARSKAQCKDCDSNDVLFHNTCI